MGSARPVDYTCCDACGKQVDVETTHMDLGGATFCTPCHAEQMACIDACSHELEPYEDTDSEGWPQTCCNKCGGVFLAAQEPRAMTARHPDAGGHTARAPVTDAATESAAFGQHIRQLRDEAGMTLDQVAERTGFSKSHVWELEQGKGRDLTVRAVRAMAQCFGKPVMHFLLEDDLRRNLHPEAMRVAIAVDEAFRRAEK